MELGKYQDEYYMANAEGKSPMYKHDDEEFTTPRSWRDLALAGEGFSETQQRIDRYEDGRCPICGQHLEDVDWCAKHGDIYETYIGATLAVKDDSTPSRSVEKVEDDISKAVSGSHYNDVVPGYQYMEMMQHMLADKEGVEAHLLGQVYKYLMRSGKKDDVEQEYRKARWYLNCLVKYKQTGVVDPNDND